MLRSFHEFENGVKLFDDHLTRFQRDRYKINNIHEVEEEAIFLKIVHAIPAAGCFLNIGAAVGYYPILAKKIAPHLCIHAVEPLPQHREFFKENIILNGFRLQDFILHPEAVSRSNGSDSFLEQDYGSVLLGESKTTNPFQSGFEAMIRALSLKKLLKKSSHFAGKKKFRVQTISLDYLIKRIGNPVDLLVMDVQGFEVDVLLGGAQALQAAQIKNILIGTHGQEIHQACLGILQEYGFGIQHENPVPVRQPDGIIHATPLQKEQNESGLV